MYEIMRYLDRQKLGWLEADKGLYFSAAKDQNDETEGISDHTLLSADLEKRVPWIDNNLLRKLDELMHASQQNDRKKKFLSCWHLGTEETSEMWERYGKDGLVLFSTNYAMLDAFADPLGHAIDAYPVIYNDKLKASAWHEPLRVKNHSWHFENEFRFVFNLTNYSLLTGLEEPVIYCGDDLYYQSRHATRGMSSEGMIQALHVIRRKGLGLVLECDLGRAIHEVRVHPLATGDELLEVQNRLSTIGIRCPVRHSHLRLT